MDDQKEEIENLRKQIKSLKIGLMLTQISRNRNEKHKRSGIQSSVQRYR